MTRALLLRSRVMGNYQARFWRRAVFVRKSLSLTIDPGIISSHSVAVQAFQQLWNLANPNDRLAPDGSFGPATESRLRHSPAEGFANVGIPRILRLTTPIQIGTDVGELQLALRRLGIQVEVADQVFGPATDRAVREFQATNSLVVDGIVGASTLRALAAALRANEPVNPPPPPINLTNVGRFYQGAGGGAAHQDAALAWLQNELPPAVLDEFATRWRSNP